MVTQAVANTHFPAEKTELFIRNPNLRGLAPKLRNGPELGMLEVRSISSSSFMFKNGETGPGSGGTHL